MAYYIIPPTRKPVSIAPSLLNRDESQPSSNPTVIPTNILEKFHFAFLIRHPKHSIPSYIRCTVPPLDDVTGWYDFLPEEAGYDELRRFFDFLRATGQVGPQIDGQPDHQMNGTASLATNGTSDAVKDKANICIIDADDLLDHPAEIVEAFCNSVGIPYSDSLLTWDTEKDQQIAESAFEKWKGWHEDAINSSSLKARTHVSF